MSHKPPTNCLSLSAALVMAGALSAPATAQESEGGALSSLLEEVVVTARKRQESQQDIPVAVSAFTGASLDVRGIVNVSEIGRITPNMNYQNNPVAGGSSSVATVYIRGIGQRDFLGTIDNGVGFYVDDVLIARTVGAVIDLLEIDRVEVLRGPQGTLFGRNNVGGSVNVHTRRPDSQRRGYIDGQVGTDGLFRVRASIDAPINERVRTQFSALYGRQDGYVDRPAGDDLGNRNVQAGRAVLEADLSDRVTLSLIADLSQEDDNGPAFTLHDAGTLAPGGFSGFYNNVLNPGRCAYPGGLSSTDPICYNDQYVSDSVNLGTAPTFSDTTTWGVRLGLDWTLSDTLGLRSITAVRDLDAQFARDSDASPNTLVHFFDDFQSEQLSQELQLSASLWDDRVEWINGLYYFDEEGSNLNLLEFAIANFQSGADFETESRALFSQATIGVTDRFDITLGGRYTREEKRFNPDQIVGPNFIGIPYLDSSGSCVAQDEPANLAAGTPGLIVDIPAAACPVRNLPLGPNSRKTNEFNPMVNLAYRVGDTSLIYATYSEGFRSGGFVQRVFPPLPEVPDFGPEFVDSFELGYKFESNDGRFLFNAAAFFTDYTDIQVRTERPGFVGELEDNIGDAEISGIELESVLQLSPDTVLEFSYGYTDAEYTAIRVEAPLRSTVSIDDSFDHVPEHNIAAALSREFSLGNGSSLVGRIDANHSSDYANDPDNSLSIFTPNVTLVNASLRWLAAAGTWSVTLGAKNITDEEYVLTGYLNEAIGHAERIYDRGFQWYLASRWEF
ncbi:MAG: TonB-dependent receptor [Pseudomonadota bacterium]